MRVVLISTVGQLYQHSCAAVKGGVLVGKPRISPQAIGYIGFNIIWGLPLTGWLSGVAAENSGTRTMGSALEKSEERREFRRISDAIALQVRFPDDAANEDSYDNPGLPDYPTHVVSLSPNGLKCFHNESFNDGDIVQVSMMLFPSKLTIEVQAKVVNSGEDIVGGKTDRFFAGLAFIELEDEVREELLVHIQQVASKSFGGAVKLVN